MIDLVVSEKMNKQMTCLSSEHAEMLQVINKEFPVIKKATSCFGKQQSQFADNFLTVTQVTPFRSLRQILAEIEKSRKGLKNAEYQNEKKQVRIRILERDNEMESDTLKVELNKIKIKELKNQLNDSLIYISGAIRKIANYIEQYKSISKAHNIEQMTEEDFEKEESKYHVMTAFNQGCIAARARQGVIDEGNHIYFMQIGVNGAVAQIEVSSYLAAEGKLLSEKVAPTHEMYMTWLSEMGNKYCKNSSTYAVSKGMTGIVNQQALLK